MIISLERKFLFVHIQKTGGSSIRKILTEAIPDTHSFLGTHDQAKQAAEVLGPEYDSFYKFAFVRNPWDRLVSWYTMIKDRIENRPKHQINRLWQYVSETASSFEEFIEKCTDTIDDIDGRKSFMFNQVDYLTNETGEIIVDFVGRYEEFERDLNIVLQKLQIDVPKIPHVNRSSRGHYSQYYNDRTKAIVEERYKRDILFFGYKY